MKKQRTFVNLTINIVGCLAGGLALYFIQQVWFTHQKKDNSNPDLKRSDTITLIKKESPNLANYEKGSKQIIPKKEKNRPINTSKNSSKEEPQKIKEEDNEIKLNGYINEIPVGTDVAILILDNNNESVNSISSDIAKLYRSKGHTVTNSLFTDKLLNSKYLRELINSNSQLLNALHLPADLKYLLIGKYSEAYRDSDGENIKIVCDINLNMRVISCLSKSQMDGFTIDVSYGHNDKQHAAKGANQKLISDFSLNHLNL